MVAVFGAIDACGKLVTDGPAEAGVPDAGSETASQDFDATRPVGQDAAGDRDSTALESGSHDCTSSADVGQDSPEDAWWQESASFEAGDAGDAADSREYTGCFQGDHGMPGCGWWMEMGGTGPTCCADASCVDITTDRNNCGGCGKVCAGACVGSVCQ